MSDNPYERVKAGRLTFKGGAVTSPNKSIDKAKKKRKRKDKEGGEQAGILNEEKKEQEGRGGEMTYTIDAAKKMKYEELFPVETKKFGYESTTKSKSVEEALDDRVKKKADRYCK